MLSVSGHPRCRQVFFSLIGTDLEKYIITTLAHQWILCSEWVPSEWVQTADKNLTIPDNQLTSSSEKLNLRNKCIIKGFLTLKRHLIN